MSRFALPGEKVDHTVVVGIDPPTGMWFFQLFTPESHKDEYGAPSINEDFLTKTKVCELIETHADSTSKLTQYVLGQIALDLDPDKEVYRALRQK